MRLILKLNNFIAIKKKSKDSNIILILRDREKCIKIISYTSNVYIIYKIIAIIIKRKTSKL